MDFEKARILLEADDTKMVECPVCGDDMLAFEIGSDHNHGRFLLQLAVDLYDRLPDDEKQAIEKKDQDIWKGFGAMRDVDGFREAVEEARQQEPQSDKEGESEERPATDILREFRGEKDRLEEHRERVRKIMEEDREILDELAESKDYATEKRLSGEEARLFLSLLRRVEADLDRAVMDASEENFGEVDDSETYEEKWGASARRVSFEGTRRKYRQFVEHVYLDK